MSMSSISTRVTPSGILALSVALPITMATPAQARTLDEIKQSGEIRMCVFAETDDPTNPVTWAQPKGCREDCMFGGYYYDIALAFAETFGPDVKPKFRRVEWDEQFHNEEGRTDREATYTPALLASGACDVYPNFPYEVDWRHTKIDFVSPAFYRDVVMVHKSQKDQLKTPADLGGRPTGVVRGSAQESWWEEQNKSTYASNPVKITMVEQFQDLSSALDAGEFDFVYMPVETAMDPRQKLKNVVTAFTMGPTYRAGWGFRKGDQNLQEAVGAFFDAQVPDPDSAVNRAWKKAFNLTLPEWNELMTK